MSHIIHEFINFINTCYPEKEDIIIKLYEKGIALNDLQSIYILAGIYYKNKQYDKAGYLFMKFIGENGELTKTNQCIYWKFKANHEYKKYYYKEEDLKEDMITSLKHLAYIYNIQKDKKAHEVWLISIYENSMLLEYLINMSTFGLAHDYVVVKAIEYYEKNKELCETKAFNGDLEHILLMAIVEGCFNGKYYNFGKSMYWLTRSLEETKNKLYHKKAMYDIGRLFYLNKEYDNALYWLYKCTNHKQAKKIIKSIDNIFNENLVKKTNIITDIGTNIGPNGPGGPNTNNQYNNQYNNDNIHMIPYDNDNLDSLFD